MKPLAQNTLIQNRYLVIHLIGKGGMGEVYLAVDQRLGSAVALKRTFFAGDEMLGNAFEREARTLARMRHPVLPKVSDHFGENDEQYLVMEHISGDDLSKRLEAAGKPFPVSWVLFWADQLLDALSYLHTHEPPIIHRDIKPQNLKLTDENHVILLDFGLSKTTTGQTNISQSGSTGSVVGYTPHYAPMEQIRGIGTSARSDLYSLAATLYQLMTNTVPVDALSRADSMLNELPDPIKPPHELNPEVPSSVSEIILRAMEVSQEKRFANAREMQRSLRKAFSDIQQATSANTIAFNANDTAAVGGIAATTDAGRADSLPNTSNSDTGTLDAPPIEPDAGIDLDATMAYTPSEDPAIKQSGVKTEVFGGNSVPPETPTPDPGPTTTEQFDAAVSSPLASGVQESFPTTGGLAADATVPFIAVDRQDVPALDEQPPSTASEIPVATQAFGSDTAFSSPSPAEAPYFEPSSSEPESPWEEPAQASPAAAIVVPPQKKKSSGKIFAVVGILAGLLLLGAIVAGGAWAYMNYAGVTATPTPTPSPEPTPSATPTPSPEPTPDSNVNSNSSDSNSILTVEPTPVETPEPDVPSGTRPTPRLAGTPKQGPTPGTKPTPPPKKTPQARPTVLP